MPETVVLRLAVIGLLAAYAGIVWVLCRFVGGFRRRFVR